MTYFSQMAGLAVQNFVSAAGRHRRGDRADPRHRRAQRRGSLGQLLAGPRARRCSTSCCRSRSSARWCSSRRASCRTSRLHDRAHARRREPDASRSGPSPRRRSIKELGTNGGGFFNVNSAHPVREPDGALELLEMLLILLIPASLTYDLRAHGRQPPPGLGDLRRRWRSCSSSASSSSTLAEQHGTPAQHLAGVNTHHFAGSTGGNLEGKEQRFGIANSRAVGGGDDGHLVRRRQRGASSR